MNATQNETGHVTSKDGTTIGFTRQGHGPIVVLVDGALCSRSMGPMAKIAIALADQFTVFTYDRRGRGDSGDTAPWALEREVDDLDAVIAEAGGSAAVFGSSSGGALALEAARRGSSISKVAVYEAPFVVDDTRPPAPADMAEQLDALVAKGKRGAAVKLFMTAGVRVPPVFVALMGVMPAWPKLKSIAHTISYDIRIMGDGQSGKPLPHGHWADVTAPTLIIGGSKSPAWLQNAVAALADAVPGAQHRTLAGQTHMVKTSAIAPVLAEYFGREAGR